MFINHQMAQLSGTGEIILISLTFFVDDPMGFELFDWFLLSINIGMEKVYWGGGPFEVLKAAVVEGKKVEALEVVRLMGFKFETGSWKSVLKAGPLVIS